jgi:hypothetical protein
MRATQAIAGGTLCNSGNSCRTVSSAPSGVGTSRNCHCLSHCGFIARTRWPGAGSYWTSCVGWNRTGGAFCASVPARYCVDSRAGRCRCLWNTSRAFNTMTCHAAAGIVIFRAAQRMDGVVMVEPAANDVLVQESLGHSLLLGYIHMVEQSRAAGCHGYCVSRSRGCLGHHAATVYPCQ